MKDDFITVPTWDNGVWTTTSFATREDFRLFILTLFKEPGEYEFDETAFEFNSQAIKFRRDKIFCTAPNRSKDFITYWDGEKAKCRFGALYHNKGKSWYLTRDYYMWINFLQIYDKAAKKFDFPAVRDVQYHMAMYELLAELHYKHGSILKKRQIASSYFHCAKIINLLWFEESPILKMGASHKDFVNLKGSWKFLNEYRSFLNKNTAWYRDFTPGGEGLWQQQIEEKDSEGRISLKGLKGVASLTTFERDATNGVGGACTFFFHEEAGIAPKMDTTVEFLFPALQEGEITTGLFVAAGSVGELDQCKPLQSMMYKPEESNIYPVENKLMDDKGTVAMTGLFIPEQWSMPPYIDDFGNSLVKEAEEALDKQREEWKKLLEPNIYQFRVSQKPRNMAEAFAFRSVSVFPQHLVSAQSQRIQDKEYPIEYLDLSRDAEGKIVAKASSHLPIREFPITKKTEDKTGVIEVFERPDEKAEWGTYYASVDPVSEGKTTTSESLCSIYVYKNPVEVTRIKDGEDVESFIERDKIVACWTGRFDDINLTHERLELIIEWYKARTIIENNISLFIRHMIAKRMHKYLVPKNEITFLKDAKSNDNVFQEYGWKNTGTLFKAHLLSYLIEFLKEEIEHETKEDGTIVKRRYGIERIPDIMAMEEMKGYADGVNVDRLVSLAALIAFAKVQQSNLGYKKRVERQDANLQKSDKMFKLNNSPFRHMGRNSGGMTGMQKPRNPFKNLR
jgi:hypothetical protein